MQLTVTLFLLIIFRSVSLVGGVTGIYRTEFSQILGFDSERKMSYLMQKYIIKFEKFDLAFYKQTLTNIGINYCGK